MKKIIEVSVNEDGFLDISVCYLNEYKWFNEMIMEGGLIEEIDDVCGVVNEFIEIVESDESEVKLLEGMKDLRELSEIVEDKVSEIVREKDCMMWGKIWGIDSDVNLCIVISEFL